MVPEKPPPKPYCVTLTVHNFEYHGSLEDAGEHFRRVVEAVESGSHQSFSGVVVRLWSVSHGKWLVEHERTFKPYPVEPSS